MALIISKSKPVGVHLSLVTGPQILQNHYLCWRLRNSCHLRFTSLDRTMRNLQTRCQIPVICGILVYNTHYVDPFPFQIPSDIYLVSI
jgi:hypothetical protein